MQFKAVFNFVIISFALFSCTTTRQVHTLIETAHSNTFQDELLSNPDLKAAHIGLVVYNRDSQRTIYNFQGEKYFIPASNTKIFTCYAAMKYLEDSLVGLRYVLKPDSTVEVETNGDPSFLHPDFTVQPVFDFLKSNKHILITDSNWQNNKWGIGWSWDDYQDDFMAERSMMPIYGNLVHFDNNDTAIAAPKFFQNKIINNTNSKPGFFNIQREIGSNQFHIQPSNRKFQATDIPFKTDEENLLKQLLEDTLHKEITIAHFKLDRLPDVVKIYSQPTDSLLKIMMHRSDNFFAEQSLLMVSNALLEEMSTQNLIDTLLSNQLKFLPQKPQWVDGSGLSRFNLFTPEDFVSILNKMQDEFTWKRISTIFASGGSGTLGNYYKNSSGKIYAKTGSLTNNLALSGYLITKAGHHLCFSILVNNYTGSSTNIRRAIEKFLNHVMEEE